MRFGLASFGGARVGTANAGAGSVGAANAASVGAASVGASIVGAAKRRCSKHQRSERRHSQHWHSWHRQSRPSNQPAMSSWHERWYKRRHNSRVRCHFKCWRRANNDQATRLRCWRPAMATAGGDQWWVRVSLRPGCTGTVPVGLSPVKSYGGIWNLVTTLPSMLGYSHNLSLDLV